MTLRSIDGESYVSLVDIHRMNENVSFLLLARKEQYQVRESFSVKTAEFDSLIERLHHFSHNDWENFQWKSEEGSLSFGLLQDVYSDYYFSSKIRVDNLSATLCIKVDALQLDEFVNDSLYDDAESLEEFVLSDENITMQIENIVVDKSEDLWEMRYDISGRTFDFKEKLRLSIEFDLHPLLKSLRDLLEHGVPLECQFNTTSYTFVISPSNNKEYFDIVLDFSSNNDMDTIFYRGRLKCYDVAKLYSDMSF